jgi:hypothetical protein
MKYEEQANPLHSTKGRNSKLREEQHTLCSTLVPLLPRPLLQELWPIISVQYTQKATRRSPWTCVQQAPVDQTSSGTDHPMTGTPSQLGDEETKTVWICWFSKALELMLLTVSKE